ncbi:hypothetical protein H6770_05520 [Candidatus Peribacteria bacterium]|nr:hypothetical protein [Candidatus Peribacteria bacterium]
MTNHDDTTGDLNDLSNREILKIMLDELACVHRELSADISAVKEDVSILKQDVSGLKQDVSGLKQDVSGLKQDVLSIKSEIKALHSKFNTLNMKVDRNHLTFMHHIENHDQRLLVLEA